MKNYYEKRESMREFEDLIKAKYIVFDKYTANLEQDGRFINLVIEFNNSKDFEEINKDIYDLIEIVSSSTSDKYILVNCIYTMNYTKGGKIFLIYRIDRISEFLFNNLEDKVIDNVSFKVDDIFWFIRDQKGFEFDLQQNFIKYSPFNYTFDFQDGKMNINGTAKFLDSRMSSSITEGVNFEIEFNKEQSFNEVIKKVYCIRNLLMVLGRRNLNITDIYINEGEEQRKIYDCYTEYKYKPDNENYSDYLDHHTITLKSINNFQDVINCFINNYQTLMPIIDSWFSNEKYSLPSRVKFMNSITMIEDFANKYKKELVKIESKKASEENKSSFIEKIFTVLEDYIEIAEDNKEVIKNELYKIINDSSASIEFKIKILIEEVNDLLKLDENQISIIAKNIKEARIACIHKGIFIDGDKEKYVHIYAEFINDLIFLNTLRMLGIEFIDEKLFFFNYDKEKLFDIVVFRK